MINRTKIQTLISYILISLVALSCMGCSVGAGSKEAQENEDQLVIADTTEEAGVYTLVTVERDTVELTATLTCEYVQAAEQKVVLENGGRTITRVCVHEGDHVVPGDVLLKLDAGNLEEQIENVSYRIKQNELLLDNLDTQKKFSLDELYMNRVYSGNLETEDDVKDYEKQVANVEKEYRYQREDLEDALEFDRKELQKLQSDMSESQVYATINGMVYEIAKDLEGQVSKKGTEIMTIVDESDGYFKTDDADVFEGVDVAETYEMHVTYGEAAGDYELAPIRTGEWGEEQFYSIVSSPDGSILSVGDTGNLTVPISKKDNVLCLPNACVHEAGDDRYVYILDDNGMKTVCFVKIGLIGNTKTEILEGLTEGQQVVKK